MFVTKRRAKKSDAFFFSSKWMRKSTVWTSHRTGRAVRKTAKRGPPFSSANSWKKVSSREASAFAIGKCRPSKLEPGRHSFASPSRTPVIHSSGGVCCDRCVPTNIAVSLASPATGSLPVRGGIFRRARPSPHFSFPKPPTPVIGRVRHVATVRGGDMRAATHVWGLMGLNRDAGRRYGHTEDCQAPVPRLECDCTPTAGGGGWPRFLRPARLRVSRPRACNGRARGTGKRRRTLRERHDARNPRRSNTR